MAAGAFTPVHIYTRRGDEGETDLWNMDRVSKAGPRVEAYGTVDELNTVLGAVRPTGHGDLDSQLGAVQNDLFVVQADLANPDSTPDDGDEGDGEDEDEGEAAMTATVDSGRVERLEGWIDDHEADLGELTAFVLPGGGETGAALHNARAVCRRAERRTVSLAREEPINDRVLAYLNRLSDYLFVLARTANARDGVPEENPTY